MNIQRSSGVLMHITSLPGKYGIGTLGKEAYDFADKLADAGQSYWQILPFHPVCGHFGYSPYAATSTFAGNFYFINLDKLKDFSWIKEDTIPESTFDENAKFIDYHYVTEMLVETLHNVYQLFKTDAPEADKKEYEKFCKEHKYWLDDFALYIAVSDHFKSNYWPEWEKDISLREPKAIKKWEKELEDKISYQKFIQFLFFKQWHELKDYCNSKGVKIIGDIPIYISIDSADIWSNREVFDLDKETGKPNSVAGVPPDYFSKTGQLWGNPLYQWYDKKKKLKKETIDWWVKRLKHIESMVDIIRIDHFRAFESYWSVPASEETAINGKWIQAPGLKLFERLNKEIGELPLIAEDLGFVTKEVLDLRDNCGFPGMKILHFAFDGDWDNHYLPQNYENSNFIAYTGTHDNNTTAGWYNDQNEVSDKQRAYIKRLLDIEGDNDIHKHMIKFGMGSVACLFVFPVQDILGYGSEFRVNTPGTLNNNWLWKLAPGELTNEHVNEVFEMTKLYNRLPAVVKEQERLKRDAEAAMAAKENQE